MRILLAEDDLRLGKLVKHMLEKEKMAVDWVVQGDTAFEYAMYTAYDVIVLDWMMPVETGIRVCERLREEGYQRSILMLTARDELCDRVRGLNSGADDYVVKPFEFVELLARIRALGRRGGLQLKADTIRVGDLLLSRSTHLVKRGDREIQLTGREFQLLDLLIQNNGHVLAKEILLDRVWGLESEVTPNNLEAYVRLLRKKIDFPGEPELIHNVRGIGYKLEVTDVQKDP
ncbi:response regulator transcription factor|uniref:DNA-binding response regulator, OmpR family, contains REC and winged-helix (WHTH) domain n=1 Tax=Dendrosporobacter quercicolus TaxID=146817 RepID=A0A1G9TZY5_9FIRM|nr:response regulator transcription factor [Dendrosporobacter quercicolus]NSL48796.1 response regulator transcription factor [Dendrosporobacter quercicolus DSM 1736]SDM53360.1 DNA-binding response regulator, OmpR family, contains REC and winged-helix (wHTH) domain [Dendrosporobacter quercicolus]